MSEENKNTRDISEIKKSRGSGQKLQVPAGYCPKCGAYVGAFYRCTECRSKMPHGKRLRILQGATLIGLILGLFAISIMARVNPAPSVSIGDIGPTYSNGIVTITGNVTNIDYRVASDESWKMIIFSVEDQTASIDIKAYTEVADAMIEDHNTPAIGDDCNVRGSVFVRGDELYLYLDSSDYYDPIRTVDYYMTSTELNASYEMSPETYQDKRVMVNGNVTYVGGDGSFIELDESIRIYFPEYVRDFSPDASVSVLAGDEVNVTGIIDEYYGIVEVLPPTMYEVEILSQGGSGV